MEFIYLIPVILETINTYLQIFIFSTFYSKVWAKNVYFQSIQADFVRYNGENVPLY